MRNHFSHILDTFSVLPVYQEFPSRNSSHLLIIKTDQDTFAKHFTSTTLFHFDSFGIDMICNYFILSLCVDVMLLNIYLNLQTILYQNLLQKNTKELTSINND